MLKLVAALASLALSVVLAAEPATAGLADAECPSRHVLIEGLFGNVSLAEYPARCWEALAEWFDGFDGGNGARYNTTSRSLADVCRWGALIARRWDAARYYEMEMGRARGHRARWARWR